MKCMIAQNVISKFVSCLRTACVYFNIQCFFRCFPSCNRTDDAISVDFPSAQLCAVFSLLVACVSDGCKPTLFAYDSRSGETSEGGAGVTAARVYSEPYLCWLKHRLSLHKTLCRDVASNDIKLTRGKIQKS